MYIPPSPPPDQSASRLGPALGGESERQSDGLGGVTRVPGGHGGGRGVGATGRADDRVLRGLPGQRGLRLRPARG